MITERHGSVPTGNFQLGPEASFRRMDLPPRSLERQRPSQGRGQAVAAQGGGVPKDHRRRGR